MKPEGLSLSRPQPFTFPPVEPLGEGGAIGEDLASDGGLLGEAFPGELLVGLFAGLERECGGDGVALGRLLLPLLWFPAGFAANVGKGKVVFGVQVFCAGSVDAGDAGPTGT